MSIRIPILDQQTSTPFVPINSIQAIQVGDARGRALQGFGGAIGELGDALDRRGKRDELNQAREQASLERGAAISAHAKASADSYTPMDWSLAQNSNLAAVSAVAQHGGYMIGAGGVREGMDDAGSSAASASSSAPSSGAAASPTAGPAPGNPALPASLDAMLGGAFPALRGLTGAPGAAGTDGSSGASPGGAGGDPGPFRFAGLRGDGMTGRVLDSYDTSARQLVSQLPPGSAAPVAEQLGKLRQSVARSSILQEANQLGQQRRAEFIGSAQGIARNVAAQPDTLGTQLRFIGTHMIDVGPGQEAFRAQIRATVIDAGVKAQINRDPRGMLLALEHRAGAGEGGAEGEGGSAGSTEGSPPASPEDHLAEHPVTQAISPAEARQYLPQARAALAIAQSNERAQTGQSLDAATRSYLTTGTAQAAPSEGDLIGAYGLEEGKRRYTSLLEARSEGQGYVNYRALPMAALRQTQVATEQVPVPDGAVSPADAATPAQRAIARVLRERETDPLQAALGAASHGITPLPLSDAQVAQQGLAARAAAGREVARDYGGELKLLTNEEAPQLAALLGKLPPGDLAGWVRQMRGSVGDESGAQALLMQLSPHAPALALAARTQLREEEAGAAAPNPGWGGDGKIDASRSIYEGMTLINSGDYTAPPDARTRRAFRVSMGDVYADQPGEEAMRYDATLAAYASLSARANDKTGTFDQQRWDAAVYLANVGVGQRGRWG